MESTPQNVQPAAQYVTSSSVQPVAPVKENSKTVLYVIIVILALLNLGMGGYVVYDKYVVEDEEMEKSRVDEEISPLEEVSDEMSTEDEDNSELNDTASVETDPYAGWERYTDEVFSYSFRYPANHSIEIDDDGGEIDSRTVNVKNTEDQTIVSLNSSRYLGALGYSGNTKYYDVKGEFNVEGWTLYSYDCADLGYGYYDESAVQWFERTPGSCFRLYDKNLEEEGIEEHASLHIYAKNFPSILYGSADRFADFSPTQEDFDNAKLIIESLENFLIARD